MEKQPDRKKTQTRTIQKAARPVSSSKRRCDGFKRASETRAFNAVHTGIVFFSPCGKAYSFDDLRAEGGMNMLCAPWISNTDAIRDFGIRENLVLNELDGTCTGIFEQLETAKKQSEPKQKLPGKEGHPLYGKLIDDLNSEELQNAEGRFVRFEPEKLALGKAIFWFICWNRQLMILVWWLIRNKFDYLLNYSVLM